MIFTIVIFLVVLSVLVIVHEFGHFFAARKSGMEVEEFGLGFPPKLFSFKDKSGTEWSVNLIPLGGFVRIKGENGENRDMPGAFSSKGFWPRLFVLGAGVIMNLFLAWILFSAGFLFGLPAVTESFTDKAAIISDRSIQIVQVLDNSPASEAGLMVGDSLVSINGVSYETGALARQGLASESAKGTEQLVVLRDNKELSLAVTPRFLTELNNVGVGVALTETGKVRYPFYLAPVRGAETTLVMTGQVVAGFWGLISGLLSRENVAAELSGPVGIAVLTGQVAQLGLAHLVQFAAMLSVNLAVLNALPFPALDGGRIFFLLVEAVRRKPNSQSFEQMVHTVGFAALLLLVIFVTYRDLVKLF